MKNTFIRLTIAAALVLSGMSAQAATSNNLVHGSVVAVDTVKQELTLKVDEVKNIIVKANAIGQVTVVQQDAVETLGWPARTFTHHVSNGDALDNLTVGQQVELKLL